MIIKIFTGPLNYDISKVYFKDDREFIIGVDQACSLLMNAGLKIDVALGDFDSLNIDKEEVKKYAVSTYEYPSEKDFTDTYLAVQEALKLEHDEIIIFGGIGNRFDHTFANLQLLRLGNITIMNEYSEMYVIDPGTYHIKNNYKYISFFALEDIDNLTLEGFKYELENISLREEDPLCISNEGEGTLSFSEGLLLVIKTNE